jgi:hypothetical protein
MRRARLDAAIRPLPDVLTWFELRTETAGPLAIANWSHVEAGRITRIRVTFDPRPLLS